MKITSDAEHIPTAESTSLALCIVGFVLSWLIPGAGFMLVGRLRRGLAFCFPILLTFFIGLSMKSSILMPIWDVKNETFNLISNITFVIQLMAGLPALIVFFASEMASNGDVTGIVSILAGDEKTPLFELGSYFIIVAGAMNYFAIGNFYDRICKLHPRFEAQEFGMEDEVPKANTTS